MSKQVISLDEVAKYVDAVNKLVTSLEADLVKSNQISNRSILALSMLVSVARAMQPMQDFINAQETKIN